MSIQKNVANQYVHFLMVDATDFATPETGVTVTAKYIKDNGGISTCSNTVSAVTSGLYRLKLAATEVNAGVTSLQFTGTGCADQWITLYPEAGYAAGISDLISNVSNIASSIDAEVVTTVGNKITSILADTGTTLQNQVASILVDTGTTLPATLSDLNSGLDLTFTRVQSILTDTAQISNLGAAGTSAILSTLDGPITAYLSDLNSGLDVAAGKVTSILADTNTISNLGAGSDSAILSTLDGPIVTVIGNKITSILADTQTISNLGAGSDSAILSTLDGPVVTTMGNRIISILADTGTTLQNQVASILVDTGTTLNNRQTSIVDLVSDILSTVDAGVVTTIGNKVTSILADTATTLQNQIASILVDTGTTLENRSTSIVNQTSQVLSTLDAGQMWDKLTADHTVAGSFGEDNQAHALSAEVAALNDLSAAEAAAAVIGAAVEGTITLQQATNLMLAVLTGKTSGGGTNTLTFRDTADSKNRLVVTVDENNNRTAVGTRDGS